MMGVAGCFQFDWTPERTETLKRLWLDGLSVREIAGRLGLKSRHAVIGKARRVGLPAHVAARTHGAILPKSGAAVRSLQSRLNSKAFTPKPSAPRGPHPYKPNAVSLKEPEPLLVPLMALTGSHCRWPIGDGEAITFCGHPKAGEGSYCLHHEKRARFIA